VAPRPAETTGGMRGAERPFFDWNRFSLPCSARALLPARRPLLLRVAFVVSREGGSGRIRRRGRRTATRTRRRREKEMEKPDWLSWATKMHRCAAFRRRRPRRRRLVPTPGVDACLVLSLPPSLPLSPPPSVAAPRDSVRESATRPRACLRPFHLAAAAPTRANGGNSITTGHRLIDHLI